jgi:hypothetical protein
LMSLDIHMFGEFKNIFKVSDFHLITLSKCRSRSWEQDISYARAWKITLYVWQMPELVWWLCGKIKDLWPNIKMCFMLYLPPLTSVHHQPPPPKKRGGDRGKLSFWLPLLYVYTPVTVYIPCSLLILQWRMVAIQSNNRHGERFEGYILFQHIH